VAAAEPTAAAAEPLAPVHSATAPTAPLPCPPAPQVGGLQQSQPPPFPLPLQAPPHYLSQPEGEKEGIFFNSNF